MVDHVDKVYLPGETICDLKESEKTSKVLVGPGLRQDEDSVVVTKSGILRFKEPNFYWIDSHIKRVPVFFSYKGNNSINCSNLLHTLYFSDCICFVVFF